MLELLLRERELELEGLKLELETARNVEVDVASVGGRAELVVSIHEKLVGVSSGADNKHMWC